MISFGDTLLLCVPVGINKKITDWNLPICRHYVHLHFLCKVEYLRELFVVTTVRGIGHLNRTHDTNWNIYIYICFFKRLNNYFLLTTDSNPFHLSIYLEMYMCGIIKFGINLRIKWQWTSLNVTW